MTTEGAIGDWSGIYLREDLGSSAAAAATGFAGFSLGMAIARLGGDWVNERLGAGLLLRGGMTLVALALGALLLVGRAGPGRGRLRARRHRDRQLRADPLQRRRPPRADRPSLSAVFTVGYTGFIVGPPLIGVLADTIGLPETLALLCLSALAVTAFGGGRYSSTESSIRLISAAASWIRLANSWRSASEI